MRTNAEKVAIVEEAQQSGRSVAEVARKYGVNANLIFGWTRLHKRGLLVQCREPAKWLPVKIRQPRRRRLSTPEISSVAAAPPTEALEIIFPNGARMRVPASMVISVLPTLGALLSR